MRRFLGLLLAPIFAACVTACFIDFGKDGLLGKSDAGTDSGEFVDRCEDHAGKCESQGFIVQGKHCAAGEVRADYHCSQLYGTEYCCVAAPPLPPCENALVGLGRDRAACVPQSACGPDDFIQGTCTGSDVCCSPNPPFDAGHE